MKEDIIEYHPNGSKKHMMSFYNNGNKRHEQFYDESGYFHRDSGLPDYHEWHDNGFTNFKTFSIHAKTHNINNPSDIKFNDNGKILFKSYYLNDKFYSKLTWQNQIKNT